MPGVLSEPMQQASNAQAVRSRSTDTPQATSMPLQSREKISAGDPGSYVSAETMEQVLQKEQEIHEDKREKISTSLQHRLPIEQGLAEMEKPRHDYVDEEVDERVAEISLDIEEEEEEEEEKQVEEVEEVDGEDQLDADEMDIDHVGVTATASVEQQVDEHSVETSHARWSPDECAAGEPSFGGQGRTEENDQDDNDAKFQAVGDDMLLQQDIDNVDEVLAGFLEDEPPTWASMAGRLQLGSGRLVPSKVQGYACPASSRPVGSNTQQATGTTASTTSTSHA